MKRKNKITCGRVLIYFITENWEFEWKSFNSTRFLNQWTCGVVCFDRAVTKLRSCKLDEMPGRCQLPSLTNPPLTVPPPSQPPLFLPLHLPSVHTTVTSVLSKPPTAHPAFHSICWPITCRSQLGHLCTCARHFKWSCVTHWGWVHNTTALTHGLYFQKHQSSVYSEFILIFYK